MIRRWNGLFTGFRVCFRSRLQLIMTESPRGSGQSQATHAGVGSRAGMYNAYGSQHV